LDEGQSINDQYFQPAVQLLENITTSADSDRASVYYHYALFADEQYLTIGARDLSRYELYMRRKEQELAWFEGQGYDAALRRVQEAQVAKVKPRPTDYQLVRRHRTHRDRAALLLQRDRDRYEDLVRAGKLFLRKAMEMFCKVLLYTDMHDESAAVRLLARWFSHFKDEELNSAIAAELDRVPSHKFVFLVHQLSARMERTVILPSGQKSLQSLMLRICKEHPFHSLYQVFALGGFKRTKTNASSEDEGSQQGRIDAASFIHHTLSADPTAGGRVKKVFEACDAFLEWANFPIKAQKLDSSKKHAIPSRVRILKLQNYSVPVTTAHTSVDKTLQYTDIVTIQAYDPYFSVAGGVNCPKICVCKGSDGLRYKQLVRSAL
jgi:ataxia telangiectasia mutated family protein